MIGQTERRSCSHFDITGQYQIPILYEDGRCNQGGTCTFIVSHKYCIKAMVTQLEEGKSQFPLHELIGLKQVFLTGYGAGRSTEPHTSPGNIKCSTHVGRYKNRILICDSIPLR